MLWIITVDLLMMHEEDRDEAHLWEPVGHIVAEWQNPRLQLLFRITCTGLEKRVPKAQYGVKGWFLTQARVFISKG